MSETTATSLRVLSIGFGRGLFQVNETERNRMKACADKVGVYHMIVFTSKCDGLEEQRDGNLLLHPTNSASRLLMLRDAYRIAQRLITQKRIDVITTQNPFELGLLGLWLRRRYDVPLNVQEHGDNFSTTHWRNEAVGNFFRYYLGKWVVRRADSVRVVADRIIDTMEQIGVKRERILKLPVRTDVLDEHVGKSSEKQNDTVEILSMARFEKQKNLPLLIYAAAKLREQGLSFHLKLIGKGSEEPHLRKLITRLNVSDVVSIAPWTDAPLATLQAADIYALSSNYEGWGRVLIEAMATGTPVVTTNVGCAGEVLKDGQHGFVVQLGDVASFTDQLAILIKDQALRQRLGEQGRRDVVHTHASMAEYATAWAEVFVTTKQLASV